MTPPDADLILPLAPEWSGHLHLVSTPPEDAAAFAPAPAPGKIVSFEENANWHRLSAAAKADVLRLLPHMEAIHAAGHGQRQTAVDRAARLLGISRPTARRKYDLWKEHGWEGLVNRAKFPTNSALPPAFLQFWLGLVESFQRDRTRKKAWRSLMQRLSAWEKGNDAMAIPGYHQPPQRLISTGLPVAWSYKSLSRHKPSTFQEALRQQGPKAAANFLPSIRASRVGVAPGQIIFFDDEEVDVYVNFMGINTVATRPKAFHALDYATGHNITRGYQPTIIEAATDKAKSKKRGLEQKTFEWFVAHLLIHFGYRSQGTILVWEHGTASGSRDFEERLHFLTGGKVTIDRSGRFGDPSFKGMLYPGERSGNFRYKAPLESSFAIHRTEFSALPGATGINRDHKPEETVGILRANKFYLEQMEKLPFERQMLMRLPVLPWGTFVSLANELIAGLEDRTDHDLTQWESCGHTATEFTMDGQTWWPMDKLNEMPEQSRAAIAAFIQAPGHSRIRKLSRREAWLKSAHTLTKLKRHDAVALIGQEHAIERKVNDRLEIIIEDRVLSPDPLVYIAQAKNEHGHKIQLKRGETYLVYLNPLDPTYLQICEAAGPRRGAWIGEAHIFSTPSRLDVDALVRNYGEAVAATAPERADVERRAAGEIHRRTADKLWNERLMNPAPLTPSEHKQHARQQEAAELADIALSHAPALPEQEAAPTYDPFGDD